MDPLQNARARGELLDAIIVAMENADRVFEICANTTRDDDDLRSEIARALALTDIQAAAILDLQVRRFTPRSLATVKAERAENERRIRELEHG